MVRELQPEKREKFLAAALRLFVENGVQRTSTAEIAKAAGTAAGTLFLYFPTKQSLIDELVLGVGRQQAENIQAAISPDLSARERFWSIWNTSVRWFIENPDAFRFIQQVRDSAVVSEHVVQESNAFFSFYYEAIQKGLAEGVIKLYPVELIGGFLYAGITAITNLAISQPEPYARAEMIGMAFDIFWDGIQQPSKEQS